MAFDLKAYVLSTVDPTAYYSDVFPGWTSAARPNVSCVFPGHAGHDAKPSLSVGLAGGGARCHASSCGVAAGNVVHFESLRTGASEEDAAGALFDRYIRPVVSQDVLGVFRSGLATPAGQRMLSVLHRDHGLKADVTSQFGCGYDARSNRLVIPIENAYGLVINLRFYKPRKLRNANEPTVYNYVEHKGTPAERRYGGNELFPWAVLKSISDDAPCFVVASEKEAMLGHQMGFQAVAATAGEGSWQEDWSQYFTGRRIGILMDPDAGGKKAETRLVKELSAVSEFSLPITLPFPRGFRGPRDLDDWLVHCGGTTERLLALFEQQRKTGHAPADADSPHRAKINRTVVRVWNRGGTATPSANGKVERVSTPATTGPKVPSPYEGQSGDTLPIDLIRRTPDALNHVVTSHGLVAGVSMRSYSVPWKFRIHSKQGAPAVFTMPIGRELLGFINANDSQINQGVLSVCGANKNCRVEILAHHTVAELELIPLADTAVEGNTDSTYTVQRCFSFGANVQANLAYELKLVPTTMPQTQETVGVIIEAREIDKQEDFKLDEQTQARFSLFRPTPVGTEKGNGDETSHGDAVWKRLELLANEISEHHTHIYERTDWHMVVLLTFFSPVQWTWPLDGKVQRGWMNTLAVGDTKTGKSEVTQVVTSQLLKCGSIINSENCTFVGLVGGAIKGPSGQFMLRWGRIPLCDRKLVVLEELSGLSVDEISNMSDVRSSGVARLDKGGLASQTPARTRLLCLSNVRSKVKRLADFLSGVKAVQELVGHAEDISRFDLIITLTDNEVSPEVINQTATRRHTRPTWAVNDLRLLCQWVWSLGPEQIEITNDAARRCLELTLELGKDYHSGIPIFKAASDRYKVARVAVAIACLQFSYAGDKVQVLPSHMEAAVRLLRGLYDKPSLGYREWSRQMFDRDVLRDTSELTDVFAQVQPNTVLRGRSAEVLIHAAKFSRDELCATASLTITQGDVLLGAMYRSRVLRKGEANVYEVTPAGKKWLETIVETSQKPTMKNGKRSRSSFSEMFHRTPAAPNNDV